MMLYSLACGNQKCQPSCISADLANLGCQDSEIARDHEKLGVSVRLQLLSVTNNRTLCGLNQGHEGSVVFGG